MKSKPSHDDHADDLFDATRMSLGDHIEELRRRLWRALIGFGVAMGIGLLVGEPMERFIAAPVERQLGEFYRDRARTVIRELPGDRRLQAANRPQFVRVGLLRHQVAQLLRGGEPAAPTDPIARAQLHFLAAREACQSNQWPELEFHADALIALAQDGELQINADLLRQAAQRRDCAEAEKALQRIGNALGPWDVVPLWLRIEEPVRVVSALNDAELHVSRGPNLATMSPMEGFLVYLKVSLYCGVVLASPWIFYQLWSFVAVGLYPREKRLVNIYLPVSICLFLAGVALSEFVVIPAALKYLLSFNASMKAEPNLRLSEWLSFATLTPLVFGVAFQLPLIMVALGRLGILDAAAYRKHRRYAMFLMAVLAVILAPSPDWYNMLALTVPLWFLYEVGILLCRWSPRPEIDVDVPESEDLIEV